MDNQKSLVRLFSMGDWLELKNFDPKKLSQQLSEFNGDWKPYNPRNSNNRWGLSVTSLDGKLSGAPDLDSLHQFNQENNTCYKNSDFKKLTPVYDKCSELQKIIDPFLPWLGRCHFIRLDKGGFFPEHYDIEKKDLSSDEIRFIGFVSNNDPSTYKFCYDNTLLTSIHDGQFYYFNANKHHSVFSMVDGSIQLILTLKFDKALFNLLIDNYKYA